MGMDFNPTFFAHKNTSDGFTLSHINKDIRKFWIEHGIACRKIAEEMGKKLGTPCVTNFLIHDVVTRIFHLTGKLLESA